MASLRLELDAMYDFSYFSDGIQAHPAVASELAPAVQMINTKMTTRGWTWIRNWCCVSAYFGTITGES